MEGGFAALFAESFASPGVPSLDFGGYASGRRWNRPGYQGKPARKLSFRSVSRRDSRKFQSGTSLNRTRFSKLGNGRIRKALYFPAIAAVKSNEVVKQFARRLSQNGKTPMQVVDAAMRKLLHIAYGVIKHNRPFDQNPISTFDC